MRVAIVTGAGRGIGAACAVRLAADGCAVVAIDRCSPIEGLPYDLARPEDLAAVVESCGNEAIGVEADVRDRLALDEVRDLVLSRWGGVDVVVCNAGVISSRGEATWQLTEEQWRTDIAVNLTGVWNTVAAFIPALLARPTPRSGRVLAIASAAGTRGLERLGSYVSAKHGVIGLIKTIALELGPEGITANAICPGSTATDLLAASANVYGLDGMDAFLAHHPIGRLIQPEEIAEVVSWFAGTRAAALTGAVIAADGGMTAR